MTNDQVIQIVLSAGFAITVTAMLRKLFPKLDGVALVWGVAIFLSVLGNVLLTLTLGPPHLAAVFWAIGRGLVGGIVACGTVQLAQTTVKKAA